ncbi:GDSL-type esterase/lipase family protein [Agrobacterium vitis]|uniref:GDSL-type esterase/lipase family protein n=1 Tax=Agrobacterium vitis TaxID=373 RepID=UPI001F39B89B|nr:GDSL-type esterase/lipase family protein [Agrobacterium vitis]MCF1452309.1 hypothetical protein [Agrobacterium vitis]
MVSFGQGSLLKAGFRFRPNKKASVALPASIPSIVFIGDSITAGYNVTSTTRWSYLFSQAVGATELNQGINGTVLQNSADSSGSARTDNMRDRYVSNMTGSNKKDTAGIFGGFNDQRYTAAPTTFNVVNYQNDLDEIVSGLMTAGYSPAKIILGSPYYITDVGLQTGSTGFTGQTRSGVLAHVAAMAAVAAKYGTYYVDLYAYMLANGADSLIGADNIHPTTAGHAVIAQGVATAKRTPVKLNNTLALTVSNTSPVAGNSITLTATISLSFATGSVSFYDGVTLLGSSSVSSGVATLAWSPALGSHSVTAVFSGDTNTKSSTSSAVTVTASAAPSYFFLDNFTGTDGTLLSAHTSDSGHTWTPITSASVQATIASNRIYNPADASGNVQRAVVTPPSANYYVEAVFYLASILTSDNVSISARCDSGGANTYYWAGWSQASGVWRLFKTVAGTATSLGTSAVTLTAGSSYTVRLTVNGSTISMAVNGTTLISVTDSSITTAGSPGIRMASVTQSATTGMQLDSLIAAAA